MLKEGLQKVIQQEQADSKIQGNNLSTEDLRDLFTLHEDARSDIHEKMNCTRCQNSGGQSTDTFIDEGSHSDEEDIGGFAGISGCLHNLKSSEKQVGTPLEEDLASWGHHFPPNTVPDTMFQASAGDEVTFVFTNQISGKLVPVEPVDRSKKDEVNVETHIPKGNLFKDNVSSSKRQQTIPFSWSKGGSIRSKLPTSIRNSVGK